VQPVTTGLLLLPALATADEPPSGRWVWGDPHAHSGLSYDGCEDDEALCAPRGALPGEDVFDQAADNALDFAALTDHAEADTFEPEGQGGAQVDIWARQAELVQQAEGGPVLPILGYEWTGFRDEDRRGHPLGSHRTVLLASDEACAARRVPGFQLSGGQRLAPDGVALYVGTSTAPVEEVSKLWDALDAAEADCGPTRWITFAHHSAYENPQTTDWDLRQNRPSRETLVEVASEHGSSECLDTAAQGCDWRLDEAQGYLPEGSVQAALDHGYTLGFVGGTDSHDARPGSLSDGPGAVGQLEDGAPRHQYSAGALTGVFLEDGQDLSIDALFDALEARRTLATSGPRPQLRAWAESTDGRVWLPGEVLPREAMPVQLHLEPGDPGPDYTLQSVERLGPGGAVEDQDDGADLQMTWDGAPGDYTYLRLRYDSPLAADGEDRVWLSPWFVERRCGCASTPRGGAGWAAFLAVITLTWRRRGPKARSPSAGA
jgi:hypothetical protein